MKKIISIEL